MSKWWLLAERVSGQTSECGIARAYGPYPTKEMCGMAGRSMMPHDRRFWPDDERLQAEEKERLQYESYEVRLTERRAQAISSGEREFTVDNTRITLDETGNETARWYMGGGHSVEFNALSGCMEVPDAEPSEKKKKLKTATVKQRLLVQGVISGFLRNPQRQTRQ